MKLSQEAQDKLHDMIMDCEESDGYNYWMDRVNLEELLMNLNLVFKDGDSSQSELDIEK